MMLTMLLSIVKVKVKLLFEMVNYTSDGLWSLLQYVVYLFFLTVCLFIIVWFVDTVFQNPPGNSDKVLAILPDSSGGMVSSKPQGGFSVSHVLNGGESPHRHQQPFPGSTAHDAVLVLDPSPGENFGHPVVLFYVDMNVTKKRCSHLDGIYLGKSADTVFLCICCCYC